MGVHSFRAELSMHCLTLHPLHPLSSLDTLWIAEGFAARTSSKQHVTCMPGCVLRCLQAWLALPEGQRQQAGFSGALEAELAQYFFCHYSTHFSTRAVAAVFARIPQVWP